eukprot:5361080-Prymnesium_polylepis.1
MWSRAVVAASRWWAHAAAVVDGGCMRSRSPRWLRRRSGGGGEGVRRRPTARARCRARSGGCRGCGGA